MVTVNTHEAKTRLSALLALVEEDPGEVVVICRHGRPVAGLRASRAGTTAPDPLQMHPELTTILYDPTEPAVEEEWPREFR